MSKETDFKFRSSTVEADKDIHAGFNLQSGDWQATQDVTQYKENAKLDRDKKLIMVVIKAAIARWLLFLIL
jgi:hypothetical protein